VIAARASIRQDVDVRYGAPWIELVAQGIEATGVVTIAAGSLVAAAVALREWLRERDAGELYRRLRQRIGRAILLGLELLVAADIIRTVAVSPTLRHVVVLAIIVLIRTFLSFTIEVELDGRWPWQARVDAASTPT
jgi:uncharacterized membrane protein